MLNPATHRPTEILWISCKMPLSVRSEISSQSEGNGSPTMGTDFFISQLEIQEVAVPVEKVVEKVVVNEVMVECPVEKIVVREREVPVEKIVTKKVIKVYLCSVYLLPSCSDSLGEEFKCLFDSQRLLFWLLHET
jgi:hypothetical protein